MAFNLFMHERNIYKERPDFKKIALEYPEFRKYAVPDVKGRIHIDFNDQDALRMLTKILLKKDFMLDVIIPTGFLIPTVPQRLNYLLWIEDLLALIPKESVPVSGIDIGTGPCAIFSLLGAKKNGWNFVSTETSDEAIHWAEKNIKANNLESLIKVIQVSKDSILEDVLPTSGTLCTSGNRYDFCLCNPPFFESIDEIKRRSSRAKETLAATAKKEEILADGGEVTFVKNLIRDSLVFKDQICLYTSMFGRKKSFLQILKELQSIEGISHVKTEFCQGNTIRWGVAWTFLNSVNLQKVQLPKAKKPKKAKPPLLHKVPKTYKGADTIKKLSNMIKNIFHELQILFKVIKSAENYAELQISADKNTWSHQRRKRREVLKDKEDTSSINSLNCSVISKIEVANANSGTSTNETDFQSICQSSKLENVSPSNIAETIVEKSPDQNSGSLKSTPSLPDLKIEKNPTDSISKVEESCLSMSNGTDFDNASEVKEKDATFNSGDCTMDTEAMNIFNTSQPLPTCKKRKRENEDLLLSPNPQKLKIVQNDHRECLENSLQASSVSNKEFNEKITENVASTQSKSDSYKFSEKNSIDKNQKERKQHRSSIAETIVEKSPDQNSGSLKSTPSLPDLKIEKNPTDSISKIEESCLSMSNGTDFDNASEVKEKVATFNSGDCTMDTEAMNISNTSQPLPTCKKRKRENEDLLLSPNPQKLKIVQNDHRECLENSLQASSVSNEEFNEKITENVASTQSKSDSYKFSEKNSIDKNQKERQNDTVKFEPNSLLFSTLKLRKAEDHILLEMNCPPEANRESMHQIFQFLKNKFTVNS